MSGVSSKDMKQKQPKVIKIVESTFTCIGPSEAEIGKTFPFSCVIKFRAEILFLKISLRYTSFYKEKILHVKVNKLELE